MLSVSYDLQSVELCLSIFWKVHIYLYRAYIYIDTFLWQ